LIIVRDYHPVFGNDRLLHLAQQLERAGRPYAVATVVRRRPPVSAQVGDKALITADGELVGWIGGSCSQPVVRREAVAAIRAGQPRLLRLTAEAAGLSADDAGVTTVPMTCPSGGEVEIYIEPHLQRPRLVAVGATPVVRALGLLAPVVGFDATLVAEKIEELDLPVEWARRMTLAEFATAEFPATTFFVVASAGHYDEEALLRALQTGSPYVALVASRRRSQAVMEVLRAHGCPEDQLARIRTPAGFDIKAGTQEEIALSVLAEIVAQYRQGIMATATAGTAAESVSGAEDDLSLPMATPALARDPVCGMEVEIAGARHTAEYEGKTYYFCCPHCRHHFLKNPAQYLAEATT
jgi:xanthine dehydrogenase accessory factor